MRFVKACAVAALVLGSASTAYAEANCSDLDKQFAKFAGAASVFDRRTKAALDNATNESSAVRAASSGAQAQVFQSALTNILLRQSMVLDMMIASGCELPQPPDFVFLGFIASEN